MDDIQQAISGLPQWLQLIILIAVVVLGALFGRKGVPSKKKPAGGSTLVKKQGDTGLPSPGQQGKNATRDLELSEIKNLRVAYAPQRDNDPDPGEVVWTWVPFVENNGEGKDRPVLIIGRINENTVAGCYLSTKDHYGFIEVGPGPWDAKGRVSYLSPERVLRVTHNGMRREGATMPQKTYDSVMRELAQKLPIQL